MKTPDITVPGFKNFKPRLEAAMDAIRPLRWLRIKRTRWVSFSLVGLAATVTLVVTGQVTPPAIPPINLATEPLYAAAAGDKPVMALALSVEFPTVGAQYVDVPNTTTDNSYSNGREYLGYYDAESCYRYNDRPAETPLTGFSATDYKRFDRSGPATNRMCADAFSGNFLNWSSSSAIDMLRLALSGGDRLIDAPDLTILQRAVLTNGDAGSTGACFWNSNNFPAKQLRRDGGAAGTYWGAVPLAMRTQAGTNDIWVANNLNRIYFGTSRTGNCDNNTIVNKPTHIVGTPVTLGPVVALTSPSPTFDVTSANNGATLAFSGLREVWYGSGTNWRVAPATTSVACTSAVLGVSTAAGPRCYTTAYSGAYVPPANVLNTDGFFYSRVRVCESTAGALQDVRDYGLCTPYPNGNFKPTGSIQKYSNQLRLAAFGYLLDQTQSSAGGRFGGVLRAPMKYVGARTFDITGVDNTPSGGNPAAEWNSNTGVFNINPDADTTQTPPISGVINYLNRFGRTGTVPGRYKRFDPVGEMYYETVRYLQGLQPSSLAVSTLTAAMFDGFPLFTTWVDPYGDGRSPTNDYSCLKTNVVVIGDINTHESTRRPTASAANNIPDINHWNQVVQDFERNVVRNYVDGQGVTRQTGNPNTPNTSLPAGSSRPMPGIAYWAHTHDIRGTEWTNSPAQQRPGLRLKTFAFDVNEYATQNVTATRRNANHFFAAAKYGGFESDASNLGAAPFNIYGNPFRRQDGTVDNNVWQDPANPGEASTYYLQSNARGVLNAFESIFDRASSAARSVAGTAVPNRNFTQAGSTIFQAAFDTSNWSGDLLSIPILVNASNTVSISPTPNWNAANRLAALPTPALTRNIVVGRSGAASDPTATPFAWAAIDASLQEQLARVIPAGTPDSLGQERLNYLRGSRSLEGSPFRVRTSLLGDIVNSGVVFSGTPTTNLGPESNYAGFFSTNASRTPTVFVGANDGMLHAFNANTGNEVFAFIPSWMGPKLAALTDPTYNGSHQSYVDSTPFVAEAKVGNSGASSDWKTVLVSGTGGGGRGVFALDVTRPATFSAANVMWEFTQADDPDMGFVVGRPQILKLRTSAPGATPVFRWFAVVPSGVNNYVPDAAGIFSTTGNPTLFLLALDKPVGTAWDASGSTPNYYKVSLPVDSAVSAVRGTGLLNFRVTFGNAGELKLVYTGDLHGNLWKLDFGNNGAADWNINKLSAYNKGTAASPIPYPLYITRTAGGEVQPISQAPTLVAGPVVGGINTTYVTFGTGKYLEVADRTSTLRNSMYAVYDNGLSNADSSPAGNSVISGRGRLVAGTVNTTTNIVSVPDFIWGRATSNGDSTQRSGWFFDYPVLGERQISNATVAGDVLIFGSLIPAASGTAGSCAATGGGGNEYQINIDTGDGSFRSSTVGLLGEPFIAEITSATTYTGSDSTGRRRKTVINQVVQQGSLGVSTSNTVSTTFVAGRLSWRQINNYQDLKNAPP